jgi:hypothetical protein
MNWSLKVHERLKPLETLLNSELKKTKLRYNPKPEGEAYPKEKLLSRVKNGDFLQISTIQSMQ